VSLSHWQAIRDLLDPLTVAVYEGQVPSTPTFPYVVLRMDTGNDRDEKLCMASERTDFRPMVTSVGLTDPQVRWLADQVYALLVDVRPVVAGRTCTRIDRETSIPVTTDTDETDPDTGRHPMFAVDTYHFVSRKI
jgi:hypothetical protein